MPSSYLLTTLHSALVYPRCTNSSDVDPDSDCGSIGWSFTLFIAWNLLSMVRAQQATGYDVHQLILSLQYIFANLFIGMRSCDNQIHLIADDCFRIRCCRREFLLCLPDVRRGEVHHSRGDARVQEGLGRVRQPQDRLFGASQLRALLWSMFEQFVRIVQC